MHSSNLFLVVGKDGSVELKSFVAKLDAAGLCDMMAAKSNVSRNVLHAAAESGCVKNLRLVLSALVQHELCGEYLERTCEAGMTPLHYAAKAHAKRCIKLLLEFGADVNAQTPKKNTPLHIAAGKIDIKMVPKWFVDSFECIQLLMDADGIDFTIKNSDGLSPLEVSPSLSVRAMKPKSVKKPSSAIPPATEDAAGEGGTEETAVDDMENLPTPDCTLSMDPPMPTCSSPSTARREWEASDTSSPTTPLPTESTRNLATEDDVETVATTGTGSNYTGKCTYEWNGVPLEDIKPLFDRNGTGVNRATSRRIMLRGSFGTLAPNTQAALDRKECVIKSASTYDDEVPTEYNIVALKRECDTYQYLQHDHIPTGSVHCYSAHPCDGYILLESFGRDIRSLLVNKTKHPEELLEAIAQAVRALHSMEIMHGDIQPQNILYEVNPTTHEYVVKLCDLDCARRVGEACYASEIGTKRYVAPEVYLAATENSTVKASLTFDMFSLGLVLWQLVQGSTVPALPSPDTADEDLRRCYTDQQYLWSKFPLPDSSNIFVPFVQALTALDPLQRMTAEQLKCRIPELSAANQQLLLQRKAEEHAQLKEMYENLKSNAYEKLAAVANDVKTVIIEQRDARAEVESMLKTLITNTHSIPTLAIILPKVDKASTLPGLFSSAKPMHVFKDRFRLFFLCSQTREMVRCGPKGRGYKITVTKQWVADAAPVLRVGLLLLKLGLLAGGVPLPVPDISPLLKDRTVYAKYLDAALSFVVENDHNSLAPALITVDDAIRSVKSLEVQTVLDAYSDGAQLEEGSRKAYDTIQALLVQKEQYDVVGTCGLKMVTYKGKTAWVKDDLSIIRQFEESMRY